MKRKAVWSIIGLAGAFFIVFGLCVMGGEPTAAWTGASAENYLKDLIKMEVIGLSISGCGAAFMWLAWGFVRKKVN